MSRSVPHWLRSLLVLPGAVLPLLPSASCPACLAAYAGVLSALGLGFLFDAGVQLPLVLAFLVLGVASIAWSTRSHRRPGPLVVTLLGSAAVLAGRVVGQQTALYAGVGLLFAASFWNLWLKRARPEPLVQLGPGRPQNGIHNSGV